MSFVPESRLGRLVLLVAAAGMVWLVVRFFDPNRALAARQELLIEWARSGAASDFLEFAAEDYGDQWGHTPAEVAAHVCAIRLAHSGMTITAGPAQAQRDGRGATVTQHITVTGAGERVDHDFHFTWRKENLWPWSWKLREVTVPGLE